MDHFLFTSNERINNSPDRRETRETFEKHLEKKFENNSVRNSSNFWEARGGGGSDRTIFSARGRSALETGREKDGRPLTTGNPWPILSARIGSTT